MGFPLRLRTSVLVEILHAKLALVLYAQCTVHSKSQIGGGGGGVCCVVRCWLRGNTARCAICDGVLRAAVLLSLF
jgi:hypothetical protein